VVVAEVVEFYLVGAEISGLVLDQFQETRPGVAGPSGSSPSTSFADLSSAPSFDQTPARTLSAA
jgi:hypothetical protein